MITVQFGAALEVARLQSMTTAQLRAKYTELFAKTPATNNRSYLFKRLALKVQEPGAARALETRGKEEHTPKPPQPMRDSRLPGLGAILTKSYKGRDLKVVVTADGFEFDGTRYRSLSAIARKVMGGTSINGFGFFGLLTKEGA